MQTSRRCQIRLREVRSGLLDTSHIPFLSCSGVCTGTSVENKTTKFIVPETCDSQHLGFRPPSPIQRCPIDDVELMYTSAGMEVMVLVEVYIGIHTPT